MQVCRGVPFEFAYLPGQVVVASFKDLPVGTYDIIAPYGAPSGYEMLIANLYIGSRAADSDEENDICDLAKPLVPGEIKRLTKDNPYDPDWFTYTPSTNVSAVFSVTIVGEVPGFLDPDLDVFVFQETPDKIVPVGESTTVGDNATDVASVNLLAGEKYLILVMDYAGVPTRYELTLTVTQAPEPPSANARDPVTKVVEGFRFFPNMAAERR